MLPARETELEGERRILPGDREVSIDHIEVREERDPDRAALFVIEGRKILASLENAAQLTNEHRDGRLVFRDRVDDRRCRARRRFRERCRRRTLRFGKSGATELGHRARCVVEP